MNLSEFAEKAWKVANRLMDSEADELRIDGVEWTGIAKILDELSGRKNWGVLDDLKKIG